MAQGFNQLVSALEVRFDFQSARIMTREALARVGLDEKGNYSSGELEKFADGLNAISTNLTKVWAKLGVAPTGLDVPPPAPAPAPAPVAAAEPEPEPEPEPEAEPEAPAYDEDFGEG